MKRLIPLFLLGLLTATVIFAAAAGGSRTDPLISLSYLTGTYADQIESKVEALLDDSDKQIRQEVQAQAGEAPVREVPSAAGSVASVWTEQRLKEQDALSGSTGLCVLVLAGRVEVRYSSGAVVDVTAGSVVPSGTVLTENHRYLTAEDTSAAYTVVSQTAVVSYQGPYSLRLSDTVDYNAMAAALKSMHLFKGSFTAYGQGFDLEKTPTRLQALIMFIRVLGEEDAALSYTGTTPFRDLVPGSDAARYVGYSYEKGYTNGYTATEWRPAQTVNVFQYTEFVLRALGYSSVANTNLSDTMERARDSGVLSAGEAAALKTMPFLRAQLVYISFRALDAGMAETGLSLADTLMDKGVFDFAAYLDGAAQVSSARIR